MRSAIASFLRRAADALSPAPASALDADIAAIRHDLLMPKYLFTSPLDYDVESHPPKYDPPNFLAGEELPIPPPRCRPGYSPDNDMFYYNGLRNAIQRR